MKSNSGHNLKYTLFGESHSQGIGITIEGLPAGFLIDFAMIDEMLLRRQGQASFNTPRQEKIDYNIVSGCFEGKLTGSPLTVVFENKNTQSKDYSHLVNQPRPGHADYVAKHKYKNTNDYRGGGHFSGRITTPLVFLGALVKQVIKKDYPDFKVISHINSFQGINDLSYYQIRKAVVTKLCKQYSISSRMEDIAGLEKIKQIEFADSITKTLHSYLLNSIKDEKFPTFDLKVAEDMQHIAQEIKEQGDTAGGQIETILINPPSFIGEPFFSSIESIISSLLYSVPSVKSIGFGYAQDFSISKGSEIKDEIIYSSDNKLVTLYNYNGGVNGGISNGEDIVVNTIIKPIASLGQVQNTYSNVDECITSLDIGGRHDSTIINRIIPIVDSMILIACYDLILEKHKYE